MDRRIGATELLEEDCNAGDSIAIAVEMSIPGATGIRPEVLSRIWLRLGYIIGGQQTS